MTRGDDCKAVSETVGIPYQAKSKHYPNVPSNRSQTALKTGADCWCSIANPRYVLTHFDKATGMDALRRTFICALRAAPSKASHSFWTSALTSSMPSAKPTLTNTQNDVKWSRNFSSLWIRLFKPSYFFSFLSFSGPVSSSSSNSMFSYYKRI